MTAKKTPAPVTKGKGKAQSETAYLNSSPKNAARLQASAAQVKALTKSKAVQLEVPAGAVDIHQLVDLLAVRLGGSAQTGSGSQSGVSGEVNANYGQQTKATLSVGTSLKVSNPIDNEISLIASNLEEVHGLITELNGELDAFLSHEEVTDSNSEGARPTRTSESPLHRRLIDRNDSLETIIVRLRYLKSRIRN
jgi:hypothetical protein